MVVPPSAPRPSRTPPDELIILLVSADADHGGRIDAAGEFRRIHDTVGVRRHVRIVQRSAADIDALGQDLLTIRPHILHISCHGEPGHLRLRASERGERGKVGHPALCGMLQSMREDRPRLVVVNACHSIALAGALTVGEHAIDWAIGVESRIRDDNAITYAGILYAAIVEGFPLGAAHGFARWLLMAHHSLAAKPRMDDWQGTHYDAVAKPPEDDKVPRLLPSEDPQADTTVFTARPGAGGPGGPQAEAEARASGARPRGSLRQLWHLLPLRRPRLEIVPQIGRTLASLWEAGDLRDDVDPDNILIDASGQAILGAPGVGTAGVYRYADSSRRGSIQDPSVRSAIFSLAMVTIFVLTGRDPDREKFYENRYALLERLRCPRRLALILARALAASPRHVFFESIAHFCDEFSNCIRDDDAWNKWELRGADDALALLLGLERLAEDRFDELVRAAEGSLPWRCRAGSRVQRAADLLTIVRQNAEETLLAAIRRCAAESPGDGATEPAIAVDTWEDAFEVLCSVPPEWFEAFSRESPYARKLPEGPQLDRAAAMVGRCTRPAEESWLIEGVRSVVRRSALRLRITEPGAPYARLAWVHEKLRVVLARIGAEIGPISEDAERLLLVHDYLRLNAKLRTVPERPGFPLVFLPLVDRARELAMDASKILQLDGIAPAEDPADRFPLYRTLCRLDEPAWRELCSKFMPPCMLVTTINRATEVRSLIDQAGPWCLQAVRAEVERFARVDECADRRFRGRAPGVAPRFAQGAGAAGRPAPRAAPEEEAALCGRDGRASSSSGASGR